MKQVRRTALITGASSGIGEAFANLFAAEGFDLVLTARRADRLNAIAGRLRGQHGCRVEVIVEDLSDPFAPVRLCASLEARLVLVDVLVNNAGYGIPGAYMASPWERHGSLIQVMIVALAELTHRLLPGMIARGYGRIINIASLAALVPAPAGHTVYAASKAFVVKFSESLAGEVARHGVHVTALCPGFTRSEFHDVTGTRHTVKQLPSWMWMDASSVAREGYTAVMSGSPVHVTGRINRLIAACGRVLPQPLLVWIGRRTAWRYRKA
ncbi:MAG: SDR family oxidoreductase [Acidimicrobiia bacterium]|nr:SDR family oxidoreductase [Acidimicrobiia bacterium]